MVNKSKNLGTKFESDLVAWFRQHGWPHCERRALMGNKDCGDLTGMPGLVVEAKGGHAAEVSAPGDLAAWFAQTDIEVRNAGAEVGVLVCKRKAVGSTRVGEHHAWLRLSHLVALQGGTLEPDTARPGHYVRMELREAAWLLRYAGYGTPLHEAA